MLYPETPMVVAGDLNQDRDGSGWYGTNAARSALSAALQDASLVCVTDQDVVATGLLTADHLVDHICVSSALTVKSPIKCWERIDESGQRLSDHPIVAPPHENAETGSRAQLELHLDRLLGADRHRRP